MDYGNYILNMETLIFFLIIVNIQGLTLWTDYN